MCEEMSACEGQCVCEERADVRKQAGCRPRVPSKGGTKGQAGPRGSRLLARVLAEGLFRKKACSGSEEDKECETSSWREKE